MRAPSDIQRMVIARRRFEPSQSNRRLGSHRYVKWNNVAAIVPGGASGLGGATAALCLARRGAKVTIFDVNEELGKSHARGRDRRQLPEGST